MSSMSRSKHASEAERYLLEKDDLPAPCLNQQSRPRLTAGDACLTASSFSTRALCAKRAEMPHRRADEVAGGTGSKLRSRLATPDRTISTEER